ncbi:hypothetical protein BaRGS_00027352 [Batillaria attramentaria]|uniref:TIR domain-containing protein n=1 Tax=Batillaria attramentaria TaxID=370345 RepID=A0ABD0K3G2_9CAEN
MRQKKMSADLLFMVFMLVVSALLLRGSVAVSECTEDMREDGLHVDCSRRQLTSLPVTWSADVVWLDASHNQLSGITSLSHPRLNHLRHLDLSHNQLHGTLDNSTFAALHQLQWLSLRDNRLQGLQAGAMTGLGQLTFLDMSNNQLQLDHITYPPGVFSPLTSLQELRLIGNDDRWEGEYPENVFTHLSRLHTLTIDTFSNGEFGSAFEGLVSLKTLRLGENCQIKSLTNTTLRAFKNSSLEGLFLNPTHLVRIEACAFCHLPNLKMLSITNAFLPVTYAFEALYGLQHQSMKLVDFTGTQSTSYPVTIDRHTARYLNNICVSSVGASNTMLQRVTSTSIFIPGSPLAKCLEELDISENRLVGDRTSFLKLLIMFKRLRRLDMNTQYVYSVEKSGWGLTEDRMQKFAGMWKNQTSVVSLSVPVNITYVNVSTALPRWGLTYSKIKIINGNKLKTLDVSYSWMPQCLGTPVGFTALETLDMSGNYCYNVSDSIFDHVPTLRNLRLSDFHISRDYFRAYAWRLFKNLKLLQTLDLSYNNLIHVDPYMLRAQRHLKELNMAGNRLQSMSVDLEPHEDLELLDLSHNMLPTLLPHERQALDTLAATHDVTLLLRDNPLLCACANLDFVRWLWATSVQLDGDGSSARNYTCVTDTGEVSDTHTVMMQYDFHWRRCVGQQVLGAVTAAFLLQMLALVIVYVVSRSWTHLRYVWKVMKRLRLPRREHFRRDAYVGYADADVEFACLTLPTCLEERHGVRLLLREREELPGSVRAESIVEHIDDSWKVLLLVTRDFAMDEWACGFTVQQAQRSITDTMPDRVIVVFMEGPARLPPMASLERLLRMVPERNVMYVHRDTPPHDPQWDRLATVITGDPTCRD